MLEVDLVTDAHSRRYYPEAVKSLLSPVEQCVTFAVATVFPLQVSGIGIIATKTINLYRMVNDQVDRNKRIDALRVTAGSGDRASHRCQIDHSGNTGKVLHQHSRRHKRNRRILAIGPMRECFNVSLSHTPAIDTPGDIF